MSKQKIKKKEKVRKPDPTKPKPLPDGFNPGNFKPRIKKLTPSTKFSPAKFKTQHRG